jgi:hypothetical protein
MYVVEEQMPLTLLLTSKSMHEEVTLSPALKYQDITFTCTERSARYVIAIVRMLSMGRQYDLKHQAKIKNEEPSTTPANVGFDRWTLTIPVHHFDPLLRLAHYSPAINETVMRTFLRTSLLKLRRGQKFKVRYLVQPKELLWKDYLISAFVHSWMICSQCDKLPLDIALVTLDAEAQPPLQDMGVGCKDGVKTRTKVEWEKKFVAPPPEEIVVLDKAIREEVELLAHRKGRVAF